MAAKRAQFDDARVRGKAGDDHLRAMLLGEALHLLVSISPLSDGCRLRARNNLPEKLTFGAVRQVTAVVETHAENGIARRTSARYAAAFACGSGVRLHVGVVGAEELLWRGRSPAARPRRRTRSRRSRRLPG